MSDWFQNEYGLWCPSCGDRIADPHHLDDEDFVLPDECELCGFPDAEAMAEYHG